jgi:hydrogenase maturation factor HypE
MGMLEDVKHRLLEWGESYHFIDDAQEITDGLDAILAPLAAELEAAREAIVAWALIRASTVEEGEIAFGRNGDGDYYIHGPFGSACEPKLSAALRAADAAKPRRMKRDN